MLYNAALRQDENDAIYQQLKKAGNMFANTIHALVSAVLKLQRKSDVPAGLVLYRYSTRVYLFYSRVSILLSCIFSTLVYLFYSRVSILLSCLAPDTLPSTLVSRSLHAACRGFLSLLSTLLYASGATCVYKSDVETGCLRAGGWGALCCRASSLRRA